MAPVGKNRPCKAEKRVPISRIDDLDSATTSTNEIKRSVSLNNAIVVRPAKLLEQGKENEDFVLAETLAAQGKIDDEDQDNDVLDGSQLDLKYVDISCLCGVDISQKKTEIVSTSIVTSFEEIFPSISLSKSWKSSGKGKKRKNKSGFNKKKVHKRQRVDVSMASVNKSMKNVVLRSGTFTINTHTNVYKNCAKTAGDPHKTGTKNGCVTTQRPAAAATGGLCCNIQGTRGGGGGGGGDDGEGKPPRKPPEDMISNKVKKPKKKKKTSSDMEIDSEESSDESKAPIKAPLEQVPVVSAAQQINVIQCQPVVPPNQQLVVILNGAINHHNFCTTRPCMRCKRVEAMIKHCLEETNGSCKCAKLCQLWSHVLTFHSGICKFNTCKVCQKTKKLSAEPVRAQFTAVLPNKPTVATSLDGEVVWKNPELPEDLTHFREDKEYFLFKENSLIGKGAHGAVHNVEVVENIKQKYFGSHCNDFVLKKTKSVNDDEKYVFEQTAKHPHFVKTYLVARNTHPNVHHRIIMEKCEKSLKDYLCELVNNGKQMKIHEAMFYWHQVVDAVDHLHSNLRIPVIHKDIKAENVLLDVKDKFVRAKLADYDTVKMLHNLWTQPGLTPNGTPGLISPEVLRGHAHGRPADVWNVAMFLLQILFPLEFMRLQVAIKALLKSPAYFVPKTDELIQKFLEEKIPALKKMDEDLADLIGCCLKEDHEQRPTAKHVLQHHAVVKYMKMKINMDELIDKICPNKNCAATS